MEPPRVDALLNVWEHTLAPLRDCRSVLESMSWDEARARALLDAREPIAAPRRRTERAPSQLLSEYKELARTHRDAPPGVLPRSIVWVTESGVSTPAAIAAWHRHRFWLGAPAERWIKLRSRPDSLSAAGYARLEHDPDAPRDKQAALLAAHDATFVMERLTAHARRSGSRVAVEVRGATGWIDAEGPDAALREAGDLLLGVGDTNLADMKHALANLSAVSARRMLDERAGAMARVPGCGGAEQIDKTLRLAEWLLREIDLHDATADNDACAAVLEAGSAAGIKRLLVARARYEARGRAAFPDVVDRMLLEHGCMPIGAAAWRENTRAAACATWLRALSTSQAYESKLVEPGLAEQLRDRWLSSFDGDAMFLRNGDDHAYWPVLDTTFERGAAVVDATSVGLLYVGDED